MSQNKGATQKNIRFSVVRNECPTLYCIIHIHKYQFRKLQASCYGNLLNCRKIKLLFPLQCNIQRRVVNLDGRTNQIDFGWDLTVFQYAKTTL